MRAIPSKTWFDVLLLLFFRFSGFFPKHPQTQAQKNNIYIYIYPISHIFPFYIFRFFCFCFGTVVCYGRSRPFTGRSVGEPWRKAPRSGRSDASARTSARSEESMACKAASRGGFRRWGGMVGWNPLLEGEKKVDAKIFFRWFFEVFFFSGKILLLMVQATTSWYDK